MKEQGYWSRRVFLQTSLIGLATLGSRLCFPTSASAQSLPKGQLRLYNRNTDERLRVSYRNQSGRYDQAALDDLNYFFRCPHTNQIYWMDVQLLEYLNHIEKLVGPGKEIRIHSGYRSPVYNNLLVRRGQGAAPNSLHTSGKAVDFAIPGVRLSHVRRAATSLKLGGVGNYYSQGFIHLDTGPIRYW